MNKNISRKPTKPRSRRDAPWYPGSSLPRPAVLKQATLDRFDLKSENIVLSVELRMPSLQMSDHKLPGILLPVICIDFKTNQNLSFNGAFENRLFRQTCAVN